MRLEDYLSKNSISQHKFAKQLSLHRVVVSQYILSKRTPHPNMMQRIYKATNGAVTPNDFYPNIQYKVQEVKKMLKVEELLELYKTNRRTVPLKVLADKLNKSISTTHNILHGKSAITTKQRRVLTEVYRELQKQEEEA